MGKSKKYRYLKEVSKSPQSETSILNPQVARELPIIFGFKNLDLDNKPFDCSTGHGAGMLYIFKTLNLFSKLVRKQIDFDYKNSHLIPYDQVKKHNLHRLVALAPNGKLHQLGRKQTPERIIGYYDTPSINLFQVCLLDLNHKLSG
ncbi:MAG TPA: hypothetical protein VLE44_01040 [Candidatus Saccharimonadales bacterium]|nr:hypothetical protein [Candidatus Saccharimonadales bacterium]